MSVQERILEGAAALFKTYGIRAVTMDQLASHLGISKRTIYEVFSDKDEILQGVFRLMVERQKELTEKISQESQNAIAAIFRIIEISNIHLQEMNPAFQADIRRFHHENYMKFGKNCDMPDFRYDTSLITRGMDEKLFREEIEPDIVARCLYSMAKLTLDAELYPYDLFHRKDVMKNVLINYLRGIATPEGHTLINDLEKNF